MLTEINAAIGRSFAISNCYLPQQQATQSATAPELPKLSLLSIAIFILFRRQSGHIIITTIYHSISLLQKTLFYGILTTTHNMPQHVS